MEKYLATIIIPIYNVEDYLDRCLNSIINQTYENLEIILVDDGSTDHCPQMCDKWERQDSRIKVIHKANAGLGMARNTGIENANGEYLFFIDSDDYVSKSLVEKVMAIAEKTKAEMIAFGYCNVNKDGKVKLKFVPNLDKAFYSESEIRDVVLPEMVGANPATGHSSNLSMSTCVYAYSHQLIKMNDWKFVSEREYISEDTYSCLSLMNVTHSFAVMPEVLYFYCENMMSLSHTYRADRFSRLKDFYDAFLLKCDELGYGKNIKNRFKNTFMCNIIGLLKQIVRADFTMKEKLKLFQSIIDDIKIKKIIQEMDIHYENLARKMMFLAMRKGNILLVYLMVKAKS